MAGSGCFVKDSGSSVYITLHGGPCNITSIYAATIFHFDSRGQDHELASVNGRSLYRDPGQMHNSADIRLFIEFDKFEEKSSVVCKVYSSSS
jgi:hypothetical protein